MTHEAFIQRQEVMDIFVQQIALTKEEEEFSTYHLLTSIIIYFKIRRTTRTFGYANHFISEFSW